MLVRFVSLRYLYYIIPLSSEYEFVIFRMLRSIPRYTVSHFPVTNIIFFHNQRRRISDLTKLLELDMGLGKSLYYSITGNMNLSILSITVLSVFRLLTFNLDHTF